MTSPVSRARKVPDYFRDLSLDGPGLSEMAFK